MGEEEAEKQVTVNAGSKYLSDFFELGIRREVIKLFLWCCSILLSSGKKT